MCEPITMAAIAAIGTAAQISATNKAAEREQEAIVERQKIQNKQIEDEALDRKQITAMKMTEIERKTLAAKAAQRVKMAESGAGGGATLRNMANVYMQKGFETSTAAAISEIEMASLGRKGDTAFLEAKYAIQKAEDKKTTGLSALLAIGGSAAQGYAAGGGFESGSTFKGNWNKFISTYS